MSYNGFRSRNSWNINLWIWNTESLSKEADRLIRLYGRDKGALHLYYQLEGSSTPDGVQYTKRGIREAFRA